MINQQADKIASLDHLVCALLSKENIDEARPELEFRKGIVKEIISWSAAGADKVKGRG